MAAWQPELSSGRGVGVSWIGLSPILSFLTASTIVRAIVFGNCITVAAISSDGGASATHGEVNSKSKYTAPVSLTARSTSERTSAFAATRYSPLRTPGHANRTPGHAGVNRGRTATPFGCSRMVLIRSCS